MARKKGYSYADRNEKYKAMQAKLESIFHAMRVHVNNKPEDADAKSRANMHFKCTTQANEGSREMESYLIVSSLSVLASICISMPAHISSEDFAVG